MMWLRLKEMVMAIYILWALLMPGALLLLPGATFLLPGVLTQFGYPTSVNSDLTFDHEI
jgi:hypothetical protein